MRARDLGRKRTHGKGGRVIVAQSATFRMRAHRKTLLPLVFACPTRSFDLSAILVEKEFEYFFWDRFSEVSDEIQSSRIFREKN